MMQIYLKLLLIGLLITLIGGGAVLLLEPPTVSFIKILGTLRGGSVIGVSLVPALLLFSIGGGGGGILLLFKLFSF